MIKAGLFDLEGNEKAVGRGPEVEVRHPHPGHAEESMEAIWQATVEAPRSCLQSSGVGPRAIAGISLSGHGGSLYLLDSTGRPVRGAIIWLDARGAPYIGRWVADGRIDAIYDAAVGACSQESVPARSFRGSPMTNRRVSRRLR